MNQTRLLELKQEIEDAKIKVSELTGQRTALMAQLKKDYNCKTLQEADKKSKELQKQIDTISTQITEGIEDLETKYDFE